MEAKKSNPFRFMAGILFITVSAVFIWQRLSAFSELYKADGSYLDLLEFLPALGVLLTSLGFFTDKKKLGTAGCVMLLAGSLLDTAGVISMPFGLAGAWLLTAGFVLLLMAGFSKSNLSVFLGIGSAILFILAAVYVSGYSGFDRAISMIRAGQTGSLLKSIFAEPFSEIGEQAKKQNINTGVVIRNCCVAALSTLLPVASVLFGTGHRKTKAAGKEPAAKEKTSLEEVLPAENASQDENEPAIDVKALFRGDSPDTDESDENEEIPEENERQPEKSTDAILPKKRENKGGGNTFRKCSAVLCALLGIAIVIFGYKMDKDAVDHAVTLETVSYDAGSYSVPYAGFGGDFYTYMYKASDTIVDELDEINQGMEKVAETEANIQKQVTAGVKATDALTHAVYMLIIAVGCGIFAVGLVNMGTAFAKSRNEE